MFATLRWKTEGMSNLNRRFDRMSKQAEINNTSAVVGYAQPYSVFVHENLSAYHAPPTQAKFLESPARALKGLMRGAIVHVYEQTKDMGRALLAAGDILLKASQRIVPVDTGALRDSGFVALPGQGSFGVRGSFAAAFDRSETLRRTVLARRALRKPKTAKERARRRLR